MHLAKEGVLFTFFLLAFEVAFASEAHNMSYRPG